MKRISFFWLTTFLFFFAQANGQLPIMKASLKDYNEALNSIWLRKNKDNILPLKNLDKIKVGFLHLGGESMLPTLQKYTDIKEVKSAKESLDSYDFVIIQLGTVTAPKLFQLRDLKQATKAKIIVALPEKDWEKAKGPFEAMITTNKPNEYSYSLIGQFIFGGVIRLPAMPNPAVPVKSPFRLGYAPPEAVKMDHNILDQKIKEIVEFGLKNKAYPGAQVLIARHGKVVYHQTFGTATYDRKRPIRPDDIYDMASVTKVSAALPALMILNGEGKFNLDEPLKKLWPKFKRTNKANLTWRSVLAHNARLKPWIPYWQNALRKHPKRNGWRFKWFTFKDHPSKRFPIKITDHLWLHRHYKRKIFRAIAKSPLNPEPGYKYSGLAFYIFPTIVENQTGDEFEHFLKSKIYKPLGANTLTFNPLRFFPKDRIIPTERDTFFRMQQIQGTVHDEGAIMMGGVNGNAGLFGTANDMAKLWQMYLNKGTYGGHQFIKPEVIEEFTKCQYCAEGNHRGLGFDKPLIEFDPDKASYAEAAPASLFGHSGYTGTLIWADPENDLLLIFLSNRVYPTRNNRKLYTLNIRPKLHAAVYSSFLK